MGKLLKRIDSPKDVKKLRLSQLSKLAQELREIIINTVAENGGHLAPNLGMVELTLAIHYVFDSPKDKIVWDVGHQCYAHKLLTGRREKFHTLRQYGGIAGFPKRSESPHDIVDTGHSSTSISAGLGLITAMDFLREEGRVVVVIGDGSMTAGLAFEGLNNAGHLKKNLIVILNDNEMSISPNVGALSSYLSRKLTGRVARRIKRDLEGLVSHLPGGEHLLSVIKKSEDAIKCVLTPGMLFEALGFRYVGPIPGHDLQDLVETLKNVRNLEGPTLVHVLTKKGKGYPPAEEEPELFHGLGPFDVATGRPREGNTKPPSYTSVFSRTMVRLGEEEPRLVAITAAMPSGTGLKAFAEAYPERFFDVGIAEQHAVTFAAGLALGGMIPVCAIYSTFLQRAYDQIIHDVALANLHVVFAIDRGGIVGEDGPTHQPVEHLASLRAIPNLVVIRPADANETALAWKQALVTLDSPTALILSRQKLPILDTAQKDGDFQYGAYAVKSVAQPDIILIATGSEVHICIKAAETLEKDHNIRANVVSMPSWELFEKAPAPYRERILPSDVTKRLAVEAGISMGWEKYTGPEGKIIGIDKFGASAPGGTVLEKYGFTPENIVENALELLKA